MRQADQATGYDMLMRSCVPGLRQQMMEPGKGEQNKIGKTEDPDHWK